MEISDATTQDEFEVEAIVGKEARDRKTFYLVKWSGFSSAENSWEPLNNLQGSLDLVQRYEATQGRQLKVARKCACKPLSKEVTPHVNRSPRRNKRPQRLSAPSPKPTKLFRRSPSATAHLNFETWYPEPPQVPKPMGVLTRTRSCLRTFVGSFGRFEVDSVLGTIKDAAGRAQFKVSWKPRFGITPGNSTVSLSEFTANDPKRLSLYLASLLLR